MQRWQFIVVVQGGEQVGDDETRHTEKKVVARLREEKKELPEFEWWRHKNHTKGQYYLMCYHKAPPGTSAWQSFDLREDKVGFTILKFHTDHDTVFYGTKAKYNDMSLDKFKEVLKQVPFESQVENTEFYRAGMIRSSRSVNSHIEPKFEFSQQGRVELLDFSPDGRTLASIGRHVMFIDAETGKLLHELKLSGYAANSIAFSHDGTVLAAGTSTGQVRLWDTKTLQLKDTFQITRWSIYGVAISPDGGTVASCAADGTVQLWDIKAKKRLRTLGEKGDRMGSLAFSPDGQRLAALGRYAHLELWNVDTGKLIGTLPREGSDFWPNVSFGPDGKTLAVCSAGQVRFWNPDAAVEARMVRLPDAIDEEKKLEQRFPDGIPPGSRPIFMGMVALAGNHKTAASVNLDGTIAVWDVSTRKVQHTLMGRRVRDLAGGGIDSLVFSPTGRQVAAGTRDGRTKLWELP